MSEWLVLLILSLSAGLSMVLGALLAVVERIHSHWLESEFRHAVIAFGGGILIAAVALVLVHEGMRHISSFLAIFCFGLGGLIFMLLDRMLVKKGEHVSQLTAMLLDFIPEVTALGAIYLLDKPYAYLLCFLIILQNIPEGFNAYREICSTHRYPKQKIIWFLVFISFLGPVAGLSGYIFLSEYPSVTSGIMLFASGGILYLVFQDIAPQAVLKRHWFPAFGAVIGFLFGMIGKMLITNF